MGLDQSFELSELPDENLRMLLQGLLRQLQLCSDPQLKQQLQRELDSYLYVVALLCIKSSTLQHVPLELLRMPMTMTWLPTYDLGAVIREIVIEPHVNAKSVMAKIVQYCMPYIKHNRLNFPDIQNLSHAQLLAMVQIMAATCLGAYTHVQRKCTWNIRVSLFWMFWNIMHTSNAHDMFIFCKTHMSLMRLCIIEYFIFFMREYMPTELGFMDIILGLSAGVQHVFKQFTIIIDSFRQMALQDSTIDFAIINNKAQICIDKCNRLCKGKSRCVSKTNTTMHQKFDLNIALRSMHIPRMPDSLHVQCYDGELTPTEATQVVMLQNLIRTHALPYSMQCAQAKTILQKATLNTRTTYQSSFLYYCLRCQHHAPASISSAKMRIRDSVVSCADCNMSEVVLKIQTIGRLVSIFGNTFYYCVQCMSVHAWEVGISDMHSCARSTLPPMRTLQPTRCVVCDRNTNTTPIEILDHELGVKQSLILCPNHRPPAHEQHVVHNLPALVFYFTNGSRRTGIRHN